MKRNSVGQNCIYRLGISVVQSPVRVGSIPELIIQKICRNGISKFPCFELTIKDGCTGLRTRIFVEMDFIKNVFE